MMKRHLDFRCVFYLQSGIPLSLFDIPEDNPNVTIVRIPKLKGRFQRILFQQTLFYFYLKRCDVLYGYCTYLPLFARSKKIITLHDMLPFAFSKKHSFFRRLFIIDFTKYIASKVDHIVTVSEYSKKDIKRYLNKQDSEITIISNFICDGEKVIQGNSSGEEHEIRTKEGIMKLNQPYFCTVSSLQPGKNLASLIKAFCKFHRSYPEYSLYICGGKGWGYEELFNIVKEVNAEDYVHFTGYVEDEELDKIYTDCVGVAYVSYFEGFGIPPLEGFYHNKACIASNTTSLPEVVGDAGVLVNPYSVESITEGFQTLVENQYTFQSRIKKQKEKFSSNKETQKFLSLLYKISE